MSIDSIKNQKKPKSTTKKLSTTNNAKKSINYGKIEPLIKIGLSTAQIAGRFGCSESNINKHIRKNKKILKQIDTPKKQALTGELITTQAELPPETEILDVKSQQQIKAQIKSQATKFISKKFTLKNKALDILEKLMADDTIDAGKRLYVIADFLSKK